VYPLGEYERLRVLAAIERLAAELGRRERELPAVSPLRRSILLIETEAIRAEMARLAARLQR